MHDRLNERDIADLITAYREGAAASLAADYGLSLKSVKRFLHIAAVVGRHPLDDLRRRRRPRRILSPLMPGIHRAASTASATPSTGSRPVCFPPANLFSPTSTAAALRYQILV